MFYSVYYIALLGFLLWSIQCNAQQTVQAIKPLIKDKIAIVDGDIIRTNVNFIQPVFSPMQGDAIKKLQFSDGRSIGYTKKNKEWDYLFSLGEDTLETSFVWNDSIILKAIFGDMRSTNLSFRLYKYNIEQQTIQRFTPLNEFDLYILYNGIEGKPREGLLRRIAVISKDLIAIYYGDNYMKLLQLKDNDVRLHQFLSLQ
ncbi:MAG: hypothetical protein IPL35_02640 [Sphingobacteriales bacterium]|nr:hypothetical protein [Sphingobacteriales bacterium]